MRLLSHHRDRYAGAEDVPPRAAVAVAVVDPVGTTLARLLQLAAARGAFFLAPTREASRGDAPSLPAGTDVVVVAVSDDDASGPMIVRHLHRHHRGIRIVAVGDGLHWFQDAFEFGADAWVDRGADDDTLLAALLGPRPAPSHRPT
jgi:hypothetical protein